MSPIKYWFCPICHKTLDIPHDFMFGADDDFLISTSCLECDIRFDIKSEDSPVSVYNKEGFLTRDFPDYDSFDDWSANQEPK